jgi:hypothetical protein
VAVSPLSSMHLIMYMYHKRCRPCTTWPATSNAISGKPSNCILKGCGKMVNRYPSHKLRWPMSSCGKSVDAVYRNRGLNSGSVSADNSTHSAYIPITVPMGKFISSKIAITVPNERDHGRM